MLGLGHEHQRYDAKDQVEIAYKKIEGHQKAFAYFKNKDPANTEQMFIDKYCKNADTARDPEIAGLWAGPASIPYAEPVGDVYDPYPHVIDFKQVGNLDWNSVMLYPSAYHPTYPVIMFKKNSKPPDYGTLGWNKVPSKGDIEAVKRMYPDIKVP